MTTLVIAEHDTPPNKGAPVNPVTAAVACGGDVHVLIAGHNAAAAAQAAAQITGVAKVIHADAPGLEHGLAENVAAQVLAIASNYSHILFPATASGKNVAPRVAAKLDVAQISDITKVVSQDTFERPIYAGNAIATVQSADSVKIITVRTTGFDAAAATGGTAPVETAAATADAGKSKFVGSEIAKSDRPELTAAKITTKSRPPWPESPAQLWAPAALQWTRATRSTTGKWARPARSWRRSCTSQRASRVRSSTWRA